MIPVNNYQTGFEPPPHLSNYVCMHGSQTKSQVEFGAIDGVRTRNLDHTPVGKIKEL